MTMYFVHKTKASARILETCYLPLAILAASSLLLLLLLPTTTITTTVATDPAQATSQSAHHHRPPASSAGTGGGRARELQPEALHLPADGGGATTMSSSDANNAAPSSSANHVNIADRLSKLDDDRGSQQQRQDGQQQDGQRLKHDQVHKLMSEKDLRRTFQVDSHDQVPEYQILKLTVQLDGSHLISPISDLGELMTRTTTTTTTSTDSAAPAPGRPASGQGGQGGSQDSSRNNNIETTTTTTTTKQQQQDQDQQQRQQQLSSATSKTSSKLHADHHHGYDDDATVQRHKRSTRQANFVDEHQEESAAAAAKLHDAREPASPTADNNGNGNGNKLIVMNLSTFGRDFKLRLKRNADFQQRLKDMKMFLAESTGDGQLRYTEIRAPHHQQQQQQQQHHHHHKQEPHKRAATADVGDDSQQPNVADKQSAPPTAFNGAGQPESSAKSDATPLTTTTTTTANANATHKPQHSAAAAPAGETDHWNIGATYHDEDNLAALLIEHDRQTGRIQVDGTIGNDFVIKPMPRATIEALVAAHASQSGASGGGAGNVKPLAKGADLERSSSSASSSLQTSSEPIATSTTTTTRRPDASAAAEQTNHVEAHHLHDDDPHDDDEMFLDEDEALELAHLQAAAASVESNHTAAHQAGEPGAPRQSRTLSKAASERKWRKYRKLMAQTQVPKPAATAAASGRARRGTQPPPPAPTQPLDYGQLMSHHIVYKQRPSSEASSSEHQHSFMLAPGQATMEEMVRRFPSGGHDSTRTTTTTNGKLHANSLDEATAPAGIRSSRLTNGDFNGGAGGGLQLDESSLTDTLSDPLGGQFYLEPGLVTGFERAGHADWSLWSGGGGSQRTRPLAPYQFNTTSNGSNHSNDHHLQHNGTQHNGTHARYKRHLNGRPMRVAGSAPSGGRRLPPVGQANRRHKRQAPDVVWPEVLLVVDYDSFLLHGGDSREVKRYFVSFWNGVDLRYKLLVNPHIRISLAGMIVAKDRDATPYLERNRLRAPNADAVDAAGALTDMGKYLYREDRLPTYDLAVVITKLDMCRRRYEGGRCNRGTAGFAYVGGACVVNKRLEKVNSVAIIEDSGGFSGIIVAAHEVGHLLGCVHDGSPPPSYLGGPGATHCPWEDGFIMSDLRHTERGFRWSQCSVEQFKHFLNGETATCLYNYPHESQMLHRLLPGSMLSLDDQCKRDRGTNACFKDARVCAQLFCFDSASGYCVSYRPAAEGSPCGDGHVCRNGKCVGEIENIIPDYTHQSQTVVAAAPAAIRGQRPLIGAPVGPPVGRLADNGLSASSTSTATSSPDQQTPGGAAAVPQISSRMDTFGADTLPPPPPSMGNHYNQPLYTTDHMPHHNLNQHQHHYAPTTVGGNSAAQRRAHHVTSHQSGPPKSAKLTAASQFGGRYSATTAAFSQAAPLVADLGLSAATAIAATASSAAPPQLMARTSTAAGQQQASRAQRTVAKRANNQPAAATPLKQQKATTTTSAAASSASQHQHQHQRQQHSINGNNLFVTTQVASQTPLSSSQRQLRPTSGGATSARQQQQQHHLAHQQEQNLNYDLYRQHSGAAAAASYPAQQVPQYQASSQVMAAAAAY